MTGARAVIMIDGDSRLQQKRTPEIGTLLRVDTPRSVSLCMVSALSSPMPSHANDEQEVRIIEVEFFGELPVVCLAEEIETIGNISYAPLPYASLFNDTAMQLGCGLPMGPLALLDLVGLDTSLSILDALYDEFRDPNYAAAPVLRRMVAAGQLGRKTGRGVYTY